MSEIPLITPAPTVMSVTRIRREDARKKKPQKHAEPEPNNQGSSTPEAQAIPHIDVIV